ncbi:hypothetical protein [Lacimicrobium sp. SS2-24]|uniref:hypothetical protein n=1 Tax=Lacimicrobium sp. SS2-24 TaxID=2005569 RepID=UPI000B4AA9A6|nr:hypothetical protein [Lacimicrobium sp. SS2-24]
MKMKTTALTMTLTALLAVPASASGKYQELHQELQIMQSILQTALEQNRQSESLKVRELDATYLQGHGVVFEMQAGSANRLLRFNFGELIDDLVPHAPAAPVPPGAEEFEIRFDFDEDSIEENINHAMEQAREVWQRVEEQSQHLRSQVRELAWEMRESERELTDLKFEKRHADEERLAEIEQESEELRKRLRELKQQQEELSASAKKVEQEKREQLERKREAREQQYKRFLAQFEDTLADTLCKYGSGLKSLPRDEQVSVILKDFVQQQDSKHRQDKIYIFSQKDISDCVAGKMEKDKLLSKVNTYQF